VSRILLLIVSFWVCTWAQGQTAPVVSTSAGKVSGEASHSVYRFKGIPFAEPPVGPRRWRAPAPVAPWSDVFEATSFGAACQQRPYPEGSVYSQ